MVSICVHQVESSFSNLSTITVWLKLLRDSLGDNAFAALMNALAKQPLSRLALGYNTLGVQVGVLKQVFWQKTGRPIDQQMNSRHFQEWHDTASNAITFLPFLCFLSKPLYHRCWSSLMSDTLLGPQEHFECNNSTQEVVIIVEQPQPRDERLGRSRMLEDYPESFGCWRILLHAFAQAQARCHNNCKHAVVIMYSPYWYGGCNCVCCRL